MHESVRALLVGLVLAAPASASADDSSAALGAGGLVLTRSADIRMASEDLQISPREVHVRFKFVNDGARDIETLVAFPLPDIDTYKFYEEPLGTTTGDPMNFVGFEVVADGQKVPFEVEQRAFYRGRDVTRIVTAAGVPLNIVDPDFVRTIDRLPPAKRARLEAAGLADHEGGDGEHPHWTVRTRFYWHQLFPAGRTVVLDERYRPVTGRAFFGSEELKGDSEDGRYWQKTFCIGAPARVAIANLIAASKRADPRNAGLLNAYTTDYVLVTGNNWKGPIGTFHMTLDKLKAANLLSACWDGGLRQTGPITFEFARRNFAPKNDVRLLVLEQAPPGG